MVVEEKVLSEVGFGALLDDLGGGVAVQVAHVGGGLHLLVIPKEGGVLKVMGETLRFRNASKRSLLCHLLQLM